MCGQFLDYLEEFGRVNNETKEAIRNSKRQPEGGKLIEAIHKFLNF